MRLQNRATGTAHARLPSRDYGPSRCNLSTPPIASAGRSCCGWALAELKQRRPGTVGQSVCDTKTKLITGRYRPVPGTCNGAGRSDPVDSVTRWDNLDSLPPLATRNMAKTPATHTTRLTRQHDGGAGGREKTMKYRSTLYTYKEL
jgi:hypothetical protein